MQTDALIFIGKMRNELLGGDTETCAKIFTAMTAEINIKITDICSVDHAKLFLFKTEDQGAFGDGVRNAVKGKSALTLFHKDHSL